VNLTSTALVDRSQYDSVTGLPITIPAGSSTDYDLTTYGLDIWNTSRFSTGAVEHELTYGGDWVFDDVVTTSPTGGSDVYTPSGNRTVWGAYIQDKLTYDWLEVIGALRYDAYRLESDTNSASGDRISPRLTVGISPFDEGPLAGLQVYGTYAEGYRSPSTTETLMSGLHPAGVVFPFLPNPDLQPETAKTWEFGINYALDGLVTPDDSLRLKAAYFDNSISDYIGSRTLSPFDPTSGCSFVPGPGRIPICYQYDNFASAEIHGFELEALYDQQTWFAGLSASVIDGHTIEDGIESPLMSIPTTQVTGTAGFRLLDGALTVGGEVQHNWQPEGVDADDYTLVNLFASYEASENVSFNVRVDNLFDVYYANPLTASTTTPVYEPGFSVKLGATVRF
jgi:hemoglobin/transferrin/lactoferrin receptor protein